MGEEINILITGDFNGGNRIESLIQSGEYNLIYNDFFPVIQNNDIAITNLEGPVTTATSAISKTGPTIKNPIKTIEALKYAGFNLLTLANNHIMDYGAKGLEETFEKIKENNLDFVGAGKNSANASEIFYKSIGDKTFAFVNMAENEWSTTQGDNPGANPLNPIVNYYSILEAKKAADYVFVIIHGGHEMYPLPSPRMKETYRFFIEAGASAVIGHHSHCYSGYETYKGMPIFFSLGNFVFDPGFKQSADWSFGYAVLFVISERKMTFKILPYKQNKDRLGVWKLSQDEEQDFFEKIERLNNIIKDDSLLKREFDDFAKKSQKRFYSYMEPHSMKILHFLQRKKLFPYFYKKKKRLYLTNIIRCEAHRDVFLKILQNENWNSER